VGEVDSTNVIKNSTVVSPRNTCVDSNVQAIQMAYNPWGDV